VSESNTIIHPTAIVHKDARLGAGVQVGPYAIIDGNVTLGDGCTVGPHAIVTGNTTLGKGNRIFSHAVVGSEPQDVKYHGEFTTLEVGDGNIFREYVTINPGTGDGTKTVVGDDNWFLVTSHVGHNCVIGSHCKFVNEVAIEDYLRGVVELFRQGQMADVAGINHELRLDRQGGDLGDPGARRRVTRLLRPDERLGKGRGSAGPGLHLLA